MTYASFAVQAFLQPTWTAHDLPDLAGKCAVVTGASSGIGTEIATGLAAKGAHVFCVGRNQLKTQRVIESIRLKTSNQNVEFLHADFMQLSSVLSAAQTFLARNLVLDILVNNAGILADDYQASHDRIESSWAVNHFAAVAFTNALLPAITKARSARIVNVNSSSHTFVDDCNMHSMHTTDDFAVSAQIRYARTKLAFMHYSLELQTRLDVAGFNVFVNSVHPGLVSTEILMKDSFGASKRAEPFPSTLFGAFLTFASVNTVKGAITPLYLAGAPLIEDKSYKGKYFVPWCTLAESSLASRNHQKITETWNSTQEIMQKHFSKDWKHAI